MITWFDIETTGLVMSDDQITQIAAVTTNGDLDPVDRFEVKMKIHPLRSEQLLKSGFDTNYDPHVWAREAVSPRDGLLTFVDYLKRHATVPKTSKRGRRYRVAKVGGFNVLRFDMPFIADMCKYRWSGPGKGPFVAWDWYALDGYPLSIWAEVLIGTPMPHTLQGLADYFTIGVDRAHDAFSDVLTTIEVCGRLIEMIKGA